MAPPLSLRVGGGRAGRRRRDPRCLEWEWKFFKIQALPRMESGWESGSLAASLQPRVKVKRLQTGRRKCQTNDFEKRTQKFRRRARNGDGEESKRQRLQRKSVSRILQCGSFTAARLLLTGRGPFTYVWAVLEHFYSLLSFLVFFCFFFYFYFQQQPDAKVNINAV